MSTTVYTIASATKLRLQEEGLWDAVPSNMKSQWSQRFYGNKAAKRVATKTDAEIREFVELQVEKHRSGVTSVRADSAAAFLARTES
jgi:hypothetical protein